VLLSAALPYLLLVSFYSGTFNDFGADKRKALDASAYNGAAVALVDAYDTGSHQAADFRRGIEDIKRDSKKHVWPWVFFNRFVGFSEKGRFINENARKDHFRAIKGLDVFNEAGALEDFLRLWEISLTVARELGSPGIVVDPETYNNYDALGISFVAREAHRSKDEVRERLLGVGAGLADSAHAIYPEATIWLLFSGLGDRRLSFLPLLGDQRTVTYIIRGMLERAKERGMRLTIVSGGELSLGYCYKSLEELKDKVRAREEDFADALRFYPNLRLAGVIAPWDKPDLKINWMRTGKCAESGIRGVGEFNPYIGSLLESYDYVWLYAAHAAGYDPYDPRIYPPYNEAIAGALEDVGMKISAPRQTGESR